MIKYDLILYYDYCVLDVLAVSRTTVLCARCRPHILKHSIKFSNLIRILFEVKLNNSILSISIDHRPISRISNSHHIRIFIAFVCMMLSSTVYGLFGIRQLLIVCSLPKLMKCLIFIDSSNSEFTEMSLILTYYSVE